MVFKFKKSDIEQARDIEKKIEQERKALQIAKLRQLQKDKVEKRRMELNKLRMQVREATPSRTRQVSKIISKVAKKAGKTVTVAGSKTLGAVEQTVGTKPRKEFTPLTGGLNLLTGERKRTSIRKMKRKSPKKKTKKRRTRSKARTSSIKVFDPIMGF